MLTFLKKHSESVKENWETVKANVKRINKEQKEAKAAAKEKLEVGALVVLDFGCFVVQLCWSSPSTAFPADPLSPPPALYYRLVLWNCTTNLRS